MILTIFLTFWGVVTLFFLGFLAVLGFVIGWKMSDFFMPPRDYWTKSGAAIWGTKFSIALGGAYFFVWAFSAVASWVF